MSIESMTDVSYLLFEISGAFAVTAVILFFALDIAKCWRMVSGKYPVRRRKQRRKNAAKAELPEHISAEENSTEKIGGSENYAGCEETLPLRGTELLDTKALEMIQDIVYVQDAIN